jgi:hypothetical protein
MALHPLDRKAAELLLGDLQDLESRAYRLGMPTIGKAINTAKNDLGWELSKTAARDQSQGGEVKAPD